MVVYPRHDTIKSQNDIQWMQGSLALTYLMKNIYGQDHTAIPKRRKQLEARAKLYATNTDMQKVEQDFITERAIYNKLILLLGCRQDVESTKSELVICDILLQHGFTQYQQLAKDLQQQQDAKAANHQLLLMKCSTHLLKTEELRKVLVKVQSQSEDQAVLNQQTKRMVVEHNLSQMQQLRRSVQYVQRTTMLLNVQN